MNRWYNDHHWSWMRKMIMESWIRDVMGCHSSCFSIAMPWLKEWRSDIPFWRNTPRSTLCGSMVFLTAANRRRGRPNDLFNHRWPSKTWQTWWFCLLKIAQILYIWHMHVYVYICLYIYIHVWCKWCVYIFIILYNLISHVWKHTYVLSIGVAEIWDLERSRQSLWGTATGDI